MSRINVSIPDSLYERLQPVKDAINVSQVCQAAIQSSILITEIKNKETPNMNLLVERLKLEKQQSTEADYIDGVENGKKDALEMSFEEFVALEADPTVGRPEWVSDLHFEEADEAPKNRDAFLDGWSEGALSVWDEAKKLL